MLSTWERNRKDLEGAFYWYKKAAENEDTGTQYNLTLYMKMFKK